MKRIVLALALALAACSPPAQKQGETPKSPAATEAVVPATGIDETRLRAAIVQKLQAELGAPLALQVETLQTQGPWAWAVVTPLTPAGGPFDFTKTKYAPGELDGGGRSYLLLYRNGEQWSVRDFAIGPTDVAWLDWPKKHNAPPQVMGLE